MSRSYIELPAPCSDGQVSLEAVITRDRPIGPYVEEHLAVGQIGQLLWAAHTAASAHRRKATGGSTWLALYACCADGVWRYHAQEHCLTRHLGKDVRGELAHAARNRWFIAQAPCVFVVSALPQRHAKCCEQRWRLHYLPLEVGRAVERVFLQAAALGLASVPVSEFENAKVSRALILSRQEEPQYLVPVGWPAQGDITV